MRRAVIVAWAAFAARLIYSAIFSAKCEFCVGGGESRVVSTLASACNVQDYVLYSDATYSCSGNEPYDFAISTGKMCTYLVTSGIEAVYVRGVPEQCVSPFVEDGAGGCDCPDGTVLDPTNSAQCVYDCSAQEGQSTLSYYDITDESHNASTDGQCGFTQVVLGTGAYTGLDGNTYVDSEITYTGVGEVYGDGVTAGVDPAVVEAGATAIPDAPQYSEDFATSTLAPETLPDGSTVETTVATKTTEEQSYIEWTSDGSGTLSIVDSPTTTITEEITTVTTTAPDGTATQNETKVTTHVKGDGSIITITNNPDGSVSMTNIPVTGSGSSTTGVTSKILDGSGNVVGGSTLSDENPDADTGTEKDAAGKPGDYTEIDAEINSWADGATPLSDSAPPTNSIADHFAGVGVACNPSAYSFEYMGVSLDMNLCPAINMVQDILYWTFAMFTLIYLYQR